VIKAANKKEGKLNGRGGKAIAYCLKKKGPFHYASWRASEKQGTYKRSVPKDGVAVDGSKGGEKRGPAHD